MSIRHFGTRWIYNREKNAFELHRYDYSNDVVIAILTWEGTIVDEDYWCTITEPLIDTDCDSWHLQAKNVTDAEEESERLIVWLAECSINKLCDYVKAFKGE